MSIGGNPEICPNPCPSVSFNVNPIEIFGSQIDETITCNEKVQPVESQEILEVESNNLNESDINPFEIDYSFEMLYGKMDQESCHKMTEGNDQICTTLFSDKGFLNKDWNKYTCTESCAAIGMEGMDVSLSGQTFRVSEKLMTQVVHCYLRMVKC